MELKLLREEIPLEVQTAYGEGKTTVQGSVTLPGGLREEAHVLYAGAYAALKGCESQLKCAMVDGRVMFRALYTQGDAKQVCALEAAADFTHVLELPGATPQSRAMAQLVVERVDAGVSAGQMTLKAVVRMQVRTLLPRVVDAVTGILGAPGLEERTQEITLRNVSGQSSTETLLREEFEVPASMQVRETLYAAARVQVEEVSGGEGGVGVSGTVQLEAVHASGAEGAPVVTTSHTVPFEVSVPMQGTASELLSAEAAVMDVAVASQENESGARTLRCEIQLRVQALALRDQILTVLQDAYTTDGDALEMKSETFMARVGDTAAQSAESGKAMLLLPDGAPPIRQVLKVFAVPVLASRTQSGSRLIAQGTLDLTILSTGREGGEPVSVRMEEPFRMAFDMTVEDTDALALEITDVDASALTADRVEIRYVMHARAAGVRTAPITLVTDVQTREGEKADGCIVLYFVQSGDTLWSIAKNFRVTQKSIRDLNPALSGEVEAGQGIVIWRKCPAVVRA